jgi:NitT/TauT family transport system substrate-binding protein
MKRVIYLLYVALLVVPVAAQDDLTEVTVFMPFVPNIQFAPVYVAMERGYFEEAGLSVTLEYGNEPDGLERLAVDDLDYAFVGGEQVIIARENERPVVFVYEWYQRNPIAIVVPVTGDDEMIPTEPAQLAGMTVGVPGRFGATYSSLVGLLAAADLTEGDIELEEIGFNAPEVVCVGGVTVSTVYINNEPLQIRDRALAGDCGDVTGVEVIAVADYVDLVANGLATSETKIADNPGEVAAFVAAFERGLVDSINNPIAAYQLSVPLVETLPYDSEQVFTDLNASTEVFLANNPSPADVADRRDFLIAQTRTLLTPEELLQLEVLLETVKLWEAETLGLTDAESWAVTQQTLLDVGFIDAEIDLEAAYTNDFLPGGEG